jgi:hypothetical protein
MRRKPLDLICPRDDGGRADFYREKVLMPADPERYWGGRVQALTCD